MPVAEGRDGWRRLFLLPRSTFAFNSVSAFRIQLFSCHITLRAHNDRSSSSSYAFCQSLSSMTTRVFKFYLFRRVCRLRHRRARWNIPRGLLAGKRGASKKCSGNTDQRDIMCAISRERRLASPLLVPRRTKAFAGPRFSFSRYGENVRFEQCTAKGYKIEEIVAQTSARV